MLAGDEYAAIKADYDEISRAHFARSYFAPEGMRFARSEALVPPVSRAETIRREYESECRQLCFGGYPTWKHVQARFLDIRPRL